MKKGFYFLLFAASTLISCSTDEPKVQSNSARHKKIETIDAEINFYEKKAMDAEVHSMGAFRENYSKFAEEMENSEGSEEKVRELEREKAALQEKQPF